MSEYGRLFALALLSATLTKCVVIDPHLPQSVIMRYDESVSFVVKTSWLYEGRAWSLQYDLFEYDSETDNVGVEIKFNLETIEMQRFDHDIRQFFFLNGGEEASHLDWEFYLQKANRWRHGIHSGERCAIPPMTQKYSISGGEANTSTANPLSYNLAELYGFAEEVGVDLSRIVVNMGAGDGKGEGRGSDPLWKTTVEFNLDGVYFEPTEKKNAADVLMGSFSRLQMNLKKYRASARVEAYQEFVTPASISDQIARSPILSAAPFVDVLKIDIDYNDCDVLKAFLSSMPARIVVMEVNPIMPPVAFSRHAPSKITIGKGHSSCSLSYMVELLLHFRLQLLRFDGQDAIFVDLDIARALEEHMDERFPIDEIDCYRRADIIGLNFAPRANLTHWFFNLDAAEQLEETQRAMLRQAREFSSASGSESDLDLHTFWTFGLPVCGKICQKS